MVDRPRVFAEFDGAVTFRRHVIRIDHRDRSLDHPTGVGRAGRCLRTGRPGKQRFSAKRSRGQTLTMSRVVAHGTICRQLLALGTNPSSCTLHCALRSGAPPSTHHQRPPITATRMKRRLERADRPFDQAQRTKELTTDGHRLRRSPSGRR